MGRPEKKRVAATEGAKAPSERRMTKPLKGENFYRDAKSVKRINLLKSGKAVRNKDGKIIQAAEFQSRLASGSMSRVQPDRRWFGNTRTIGQQQLDQFREAVRAKANNPFEVLLHRNKLPMTLLTDTSKMGRMNLLGTEAFSDTFGPKAQRKRPKIKMSTFEEMAVNVNVLAENYEHENDKSLLSNQVDEKTELTKEWYERAGQSRRIWNELYKVSFHFVRDILCDAPETMIIHL